MQGKGKDNFQKKKKNIVRTLKRELNSKKKKPLLEKK